jgi:paired amphipathic helix protein Sin3a
MLPPMNSAPQPMGAKPFQPPQSTNPYPPPQSFFNSNLPHQSHQVHAQQPQPMQHAPRQHTQQQPPMHMNHPYQQQQSGFAGPQGFSAPMIQQQQQHHHHQSQNQHQPAAPNMQPPVPMPNPNLAPLNAPKAKQVEFNHAISYVNKIKTRFAAEPDKYKQFLEILQTYKQSKPIKEVYKEVSELFKGSADLLDEFKQFLPDVSAKREGTSRKFN